MGGLLGGSIASALAAAALTRWQDLARTMGRSGGAKLTNRPAADAQPADVNTWLNEAHLSPFFAFPEWPWTTSGDTATAHYLLGPNDGVTWTATSDGLWQYDHKYGGTDLGQILDSVVSAAAIGADLAGFVFLGMFLHTAQAAADHEPIASLGSALAADWTRMENASDLATTIEGYIADPPQLLFAVENGDWKKAWNQATNYGADLTGIVSAFAPGKAPDASGSLTIEPAPSKTTFSASTGTPVFTIAKAKPPMQFTLTKVMPVSLANAIGMSSANIAAGQASGAIADPQAVAAFKAATPPPAPAPTPWYSRKILGPVTVGETGILAGAAFAAWKMVRG